MSQQTGENLPHEAENETAESGSNGAADRTVPLAALEDERRKRQRLETQLAELKGKVDGLSSGAAHRQDKPEEKELSRAELQAMVDRGDLTTSQAEALLDEYQRKRIEKQIEQQVQARIGAQTRQTTLQQEMAKYLDAVPDIGQEGTEAREAVRREWNQLTTVLGYPTTAETELIACRTVFGPPERLSKRHERGKHETHQETGGGQPEDAGGSHSGAPKDMSSRERKHYERLIEQGLYKNWEEVKKEYGFKKARKRAE